MESSTREKGARGEALARGYLETLGWEILSENFQTRFGEIDLVGRDQDFLVFVEVKLRKQNSLGSPEEAVDSRKQRRLTLAAQEYLQYSGWAGFCRFDVLALEMPTKGEPAIRHHRNAFQAIE